MIYLVQDDQNSPKNTEMNKKILEKMVRKIKQDYLDGLFWKKEEMQYLID